MTTTFTEYTQHAKSQDADTYLGHLVWYMVAETTVEHSVLHGLLKKHNLEFACPRAPRDEDVFRRCAPNGHRKKVVTTNNEIHVNYLIRQVKRNGGVCTKHIVAETVDASGETLDYEEVYELKYANGSLTSSPLGAGDYTAGLIAEEIEQDYLQTKGRVDGNALRTVIRKVMDQARATAVRPAGGVYFVMAQYSDLVEALEAAVEPIAGTQVHSLPLVDDKKQRDMLRRAYEAETVEEVERSLGEIAELLKREEEITSDQYARLSSRFSLLSTKNKEYMKLLQTTVDETDTKLDIYRLQMTQLLTKVKA